LLLAIRDHIDAQKGKRGQRPPYIELVNRSTIVLICAIWEAYCEDLCAETLEKIIEVVGNDHKRLPEMLRTFVAQKIKSETSGKDVDKIWRLAGEGWKKVLRDNLKGYLEKYIGGFNWPKWEGVEALFKKTLGLPQITKNWAWKACSVKNSKKRLNHYVELRGEIAHRGRASTTVKLTDVKGFLDLIRRIALKMEETVAEHLKACSA